MGVTMTMNKASEWPLSASSIERIEAIEAEIARITHMTESEVALEIKRVLALHHENAEAILGTIARAAAKFGPTLESLEDLKLSCGYIEPSLESPPKRTWKRKQFFSD
jgi:hypothetical protein